MQYVCLSFCFSSLYLNLDRKASIFSHWADIIENLEIKDSYNRIYLGVKKIEFDEGVEKQIPKKYLVNDIFKTRSAQKIEYYIAKHHNIPLIPFTLGVALGGKGSMGLITRFTDSISKELVLPEIDYGINLTIRKFRKKN